MDWLLCYAATASLLAPSFWMTTMAATTTKPMISVVKPGIIIIRPPTAISTRKMGFMCLNRYPFKPAPTPKIPRSNVLRWTLSDGSWAIARPSGTEPKLKIYTGVRGDSEADADGKLAALAAAMDELLKPYLE